MGILLKNIDLAETHLPILEVSTSDPNKVQAIIFNEGGKRYYFSNELGHKVITSAEERPMSKKEYKEALQRMTEKTMDNAEDPDQIMDELIKLDFGMGHANSTFQINRPCIGDNRIGALIINRGFARYIYNADSNTVFHIDHSRNINGSFMKEGSEKDEIIHTLTTSKTLRKKIESLKTS